MNTDGVSLGGDNPVETSETPPVGQDSSADYSLASPFLNEVSPDHRAIVAPYIKKWDAGVTKKFQEYATKLKPYEQLGVPPEELQRFVNLGRHVQTNPENVFRIMWEGLQEQYGENFDAELMRILQIEMEEEMAEDFDGGYEYEDAPDENQVFQQNVSQELEELRAWREEMVEAQQSAEENAQLDNVLQGMHNKFGDFDNNWVLVRLAEHGNIDKAMQEWNQMLSRYNQGGGQRQAPKVMGGQGGIPSGQIDTKSLRGKDRRDVVAQMLEQAG